MKALYNATNGKSWTIEWDFSSTIDHCSFSGVTCNNPSLNNVIDLNLSFSNLTGTIPNQINNLTFLQNFYLTSNQLSGTINISGLTKLEFIFLNGNQFTGPILPQLYHLTQLQAIYANYNQFSGTINSLINNLSQLRNIYLRSNQFSGVLPDFNITQLQELVISNNSFEGKSFVL